MKYKYKYAAFIIILAAVLIASPVYYIRNKEKTGIQEQYTFNRNNGDRQNNTVQINNVLYNKDGISAEYPVIIQGGSTEKLGQWNKIIQEDFNKILKLYSFNPFPELTPVPSGRIPTILKITYEIKADNDKLISILYTAAYYSPYSAHPTELVYTTNISKTDDRRLKLSDIVILNNDFVKNFRTWDFKSQEKNNEEFNQAIKDYVANLSDEDLLMGFQAADIIGSGNLWGINSYLTEDKLGISLGVPNYIGDHVEFEREYSKLKEFMK